MHRQLIPLFYFFEYLNNNQHVYNNDERTHALNKKQRQQYKRNLSLQYQIFQFLYNFLDSEGRKIALFHSYLKEKTLHQRLHKQSLYYRY